MSKDTTTRLSSIEIIRCIFNAFALEQRPCSVKQLEDITQLPKSTLYKFLKELKNINFISMTPDKKYFIGDKIAIYGELYNTSNMPLQAIKKVAHDLAMETGLTAQVCTLVQGKYMVLHEVIPETEYAIRSLVLGRNVPITWTTSGRLLLDAKSREDLWASLSEEDLKLPDGTPVSISQLHQEIVDAHRDNYAEFQSPINNNCTCMATLIVNDGITRYTLCLSIKKEHAPALRQNAAETLLRYAQDFHKQTQQIP